MHTLGTDIFPRLFGLINSDPHKRARGWKGPGYRGVVMELLPRMVSHQYIQPVNPERKILDKVDSFLAAIDISPMALPWYRAVAASRLSRIQTLHSVGIIHGDCTNHNFQMDEKIHDGPCHDFSLAYTFSKERPIMMCASIRALSYHEAVGADEAAVLETVLEMYVSPFRSLSDWSRVNDHKFEKYLDQILGFNKTEISGSSSDLSLQRSPLPLDIVVLRNVKTIQGWSTSKRYMSEINQVQNSHSSLQYPQLSPSLNLGLPRCPHRRYMKW